MTIVATSGRKVGVVMSGSRRRRTQSTAAMALLALAVVGCGGSSPPLIGPSSGGQYTSLGPGFSSRPSPRSSVPVPTPSAGRLVVDGFDHYQQTIPVAVGTTIVVQPRRNPVGSTFETPQSKDQSVLSPVSHEQLSDGTPTATFLASSPGLANVTAKVLQPSCGSESPCQGDFLVHFDVSP